MQNLLNILIVDCRYLERMAPYIGTGVLVIVIFVIVLHQLDAHTDVKIAEFLKVGELNE